MTDSLGLERCWARRWANNTNEVGYLAVRTQVARTHLDIEECERRSCKEEDEGNEIWPLAHAMLYAGESQPQLVVLDTA